MCSRRCGRAASTCTGAPALAWRRSCLSPRKNASLDCLNRLEHEYSLKAELDAAWAVRPVGLSRFNDRMTLVLEDPGGEPLDRLVGPPLGITEFLHIAISLATALRRMHERGIVHKDIKPANVMVDRASGGVWLTGFGIASRLPRERQAPDAPEVIAGTLAYMAPEQTGRMNRSIDSRSDLCALGVTLYELLTGAPHRHLQLECLQRRTFLVGGEIQDLWIRQCAFRHCRYGPSTRSRSCSRATDNRSRIARWEGFRSRTSTADAG